jgi:hypothetical protein
MLADGAEQVIPLPLVSELFEFIREFGEKVSKA